MCLVQPPLLVILSVSSKLFSMGLGIQSGHSAISIAVINVAHSGLPCAEFHMDIFDQACSEIPKEVRLLSHFPCDRSVASLTCMTD